MYRSVKCPERADTPDRRGAGAFRPAGPVPPQHTLTSGPAPVRLAVPAWTTRRPDRVARTERGPVVIPVCRLEDLPEGESVRVETTPPVAVFRTDDGELYAIDDTCTHQ